MMTYIVWGIVCLVLALAFHIYLMIQDPSLVAEVDKEAEKLQPKKSFGWQSQITVVMTFLIAVAIWPVAVGWLMYLLYQGETLANWFYRSFKKQNNSKE